MYFVYYDDNRATQEFVSEFETEIEAQEYIKNNERFYDGYLFIDTEDYY